MVMETINSLFVVCKSTELTWRNFNEISFKYKKSFIYTRYVIVLFLLMLLNVFFWASRGMSVMDVVYTEIIYSGVVVLLELPTGMLADRFSRKTWILLDALMSLVEFVIIIFATSFWHFAWPLDCRLLVMPFKVVLLMHWYMTA